MSKTEREASKVNQLEQWIKDICRYDRVDDFIQVIDESGGPSKRGGSELRFTFNIYTETHRYRITALDRSKDEGYLGCTVSNRKPRAGEDWTRGNDLPDGKFTRETWEQIKNGIITYELIKLAPKKEAIVDEEKKKK